MPLHALKWIFGAKPANAAFYEKIEAYVISCLFLCAMCLSFPGRAFSLFTPPSTLHRIITVDGFLVQGVDEVAGILYGVFEVADGVCAAALAPHALLGGLRLVFQLTESGLLWTGHTKKKKKKKGGKFKTVKKVRHFKL